MYQIESNHEALILASETTRLRVGFVHKRCGLDRFHFAKEVAAAAVVAAVGIYDSMEQAARLVLDSGGQATSEFIGHRWGVSSGQQAL